MYGDNPSKSQKAILKSALSTEGRITFVRSKHRKTKIEVIDGVTVVTSYYDLESNFLVHGWTVDTGKTALTDAGMARARRLRS